jgi:hypothetical protein
VDVHGVGCWKDGTGVEDPGPWTSAPLPPFSHPPGEPYCYMVLLLLPLPLPLQHASVYSFLAWSTPIESGRGPGL